MKIWHAAVLFWVIVGGGLAGLLALSSPPVALGPQILASLPPVAVEDLPAVPAGGAEPMPVWRDLPVDRDSPESLDEPDLGANHLPDLVPIVTSPPPDVHKTQPGAHIPQKVDESAERRPAPRPAAKRPSPPPQPTPTAADAPYIIRPGAITLMVRMRADVIDWRLRVFSGQ